MAAQKNNIFLCFSSRSARRKFEVVLGFLGGKYVENYIIFLKNKQLLYKKTFT